MKWSVLKRDGRWRIYDRGVFFDTYPTLVEAHTAATQLAVSDELFRPGGLTCLATLREREREWIRARYGPPEGAEPLADWELELIYSFYGARVDR